MSMSSTAKAVIVALSLVLLAPLALINLQSTDSLVRFHNRSLASWPDLIKDRRNPALYFDGLNRWISDRMYPIIALNRLKTGFTYYVLKQPPSPNVSMGANGLLFLNGADAAHENNLVDSSCVEAADPAALRRLEAALERIAAFGKSRGTPIDVLMVPTIPVLYGDRLPRSLPSALREACLASFLRQGTVSAIRVPDGMHFIYPFAELKTLRDDSAMYPNGNYHASGLSVRTASDAVLRSIGAVPSTTALVQVEGPSEVLGSRDLRVSFPRYVVNSLWVAADDEITAALNDVTALYRDDPGQTIVAYRNPTAPNPVSLFILSDSFGTNQASDLSFAVQSVIQMQTPHRDVAGMIDAVRGVVAVDRMLLVFNDTNLGRLSEFGEHLSLPAGR
jgi:hypothetical protein